MIVGYYIHNLDILLALIWIKSIVHNKMKSIKGHRRIRSKKDLFGDFSHIASVKQHVFSIYVPGLTLGHYQHFCRKKKKIYQQAKICFSGEGCFCDGTKNF